MDNIIEFLKHKPVYLQERKFMAKFPDEYARISEIVFPEDFVFQQKLYHYYNNDLGFQLGICPTCGNRCRFKTFGGGYFEYCSKRCIYTKERSCKCKVTKLERYGDENYNNPDKAKDTCMMKYGVVNISCVESIKHGKINKRISKSEEEKLEIRNRVARSWQMKSDFEIQETINKTKRTKLERYGDETYSNPDKTKRTKFERYGCETYVNHKKMVATKRAKRLASDENVIGYTEEGATIRKCTMPECNGCDEKCYEIFDNIHYDRLRLGYVTCTKLNPVDKHISGCENELYDFISSIYQGYILKNDRTLLGGSEIDVYLPDLKLAFEFNGLYWHSDVYKDKYYHYEKSKKCAEVGVQLIHVWEDDWLYRREIVENLIRGKLGLHDVKISARDCRVVELDSKTAKEFCTKYHIQGYANSTVRLGLEHDGNVVMVALFGKRRRICGGVPKDGEWELYRMCSPFGIRVRGGSSKLLKYFVNMAEPLSVTTFADICVSDGDVYEKTGFVMDGVVPPSYCWIVRNKRVPRYRFQKSRLVECLDNPDLSENEIMRMRGCHKIYDAGKIKYVYIFDNQKRS